LLIIIIITIIITLLTALAIFEVIIMRSDLSIVGEHCFANEIN